MSNALLGTALSGISTTIFLIVYAVVYNGFSNRDTTGLVLQWCLGLCLQMNLYCVLWAFKEIGPHSHEKEDSDDTWEEWLEKISDWFMENVFDRLYSIFVKDSEDDESLSSSSEEKSDESSDGSMSGSSAESKSSSSNDSSSKSDDDESDDAKDFESKTVRLRHALFISFRLNECV